MLKRIRAGGSESGARIEAVDYGVLTCGNGEIVRRFVSSTGIGFNAAVRRRMNCGRGGRGESQIKTPLGYVSAVIRELFFFRPVKGYILLDVRRADEFATGHIPGAVNLPNEQIGKSEIPSLPDKNQTIYIYCRSGNRSKQAADKLLALGYTNLIEFGGILDYTGELEY